MLDKVKNLISTLDIDIQVNLSDIIEYAGLIAVGINDDMKPEEAITWMLLVMAYEKRITANRGDQIMAAQDATEITREVIRGLAEQIG